MICNQKPEPSETCFNYVGVIWTLICEYQKFMTYLLVYNIYVYIDLYNLVFVYKFKLKKSIIYISNLLYIYKNYNIHIFYHFKETWEIF